MAKAYTSVQKVLMKITIMLLIFICIYLVIVKEANNGIRLNQEEINLTNIEVLKQFSDEMIESSRRNSLYEDYDGDKYLQYIWSARHTKDIRVVKVLMRCLVYELKGPEQDILESLASVDYRLYYQAFFELSDDFLESEGGRFALMDQLVSYYEYNGVPPAKEEWSTIYNIARENLSIDSIKEILNIYHKKEIGYFGTINYPMENDESSIYPQFYQLFKKLLKEKK